MRWTTLAESSCYKYWNLLSKQRIFRSSLLLVLVRFSWLALFQVHHGASLRAAFIPSKIDCHRANGFGSLSTALLLKADEVATTLMTPSQHQFTAGGEEYRNDFATTYSTSLGHISRMDLEESHSSLLEAMGVPTFVCSGGGILDGPDDDIWPPIEQCTAKNLTWCDDHPDAPDWNERYGPAFTISSILSDSVCQDIIASCELAVSKMESLQSTITSMNRHHGSAPSEGSGIKNHHGAMQLMVSQATANTIADRIAPFISLPFVECRKLEMDVARASLSSSDSTTAHPNSQLMFVGLNRRFRIYKYAPNAQDRFAPHIDAGFPPSGVRTRSNGTTTSNITFLVFDDTENVVSLLNKELLDRSSPLTIRNVVSRLTVLFYLNDNFLGGETNFYRPTPVQPCSLDESEPIASVRPQAGSCLIFPQCVGEDVMEMHARRYWPLHEGSPVQTSRSNPKYVIRSDLLFAELCGE